MRALAKRYGINQKTVAKLQSRICVLDLPTGPKEARSTVLTVEKEAVIVAFRRYTLLPLDDCLYAFEYACAMNDIEHRTTKAKHPWTDGQVERMNRTIKDATVKRFY